MSSQSKIKLSTVKWLINNKLYQSLKTKTLAQVKEKDK